MCNTGIPVSSGDSKSSHRFHSPSIPPETHNGLAQSLNMYSTTSISPDIGCHRANRGLLPFASSPLACRRVGPARGPCTPALRPSIDFTRGSKHHRALPIASQEIIQSVADASSSFNPLPIILFFTPGLLTVLYAFIKGKGNLSDGLSRLLTEVSQGYFQPSMGGENIPTAEGELSDLAGDEPLFKALYQWFMDNGGVFKLAFGPKAFIVISDPVVVKHLLKDNAFNYDKGVLAEILEPIMGKGLIPADLETWKVRRRQIVPAFHQAYLQNCVKMFGECTKKTIERLDSASGSGAVIDMEQEFLNLGLDIIGIGVFNYDFGSINQQSPVIQAVYGTDRTRRVSSPGFRSRSLVNTPTYSPTHLLTHTSTYISTHQACSRRPSTDQRSTSRIGIFRYRSTSFPAKFSSIRTSRSSMNAWTS